jgi:sugar O-acyltransferase (sialic acid O-acetyltransferase NeuD family)
METNKKSIVVIGYSGHAYVAIDIFFLAGRLVASYCDNEEKTFNPYNLTYLGKETDKTDKLLGNDFFAAIGHNGIREKIHHYLSPLLGPPVNALHPKSIISSSVKMGSGVMVAANATINAVVAIGDGVICNTSSSIDHECVIGDFCHIAPGAVICGNVNIGARSFIGANSVITQGIKIGQNVTIGAGSVVIRDVPDNMKVIGNPAKPVL